MDDLTSCFILGSVYMLVLTSQFCLYDFSFSFLSWLFVSVLLFPLGWKCMVSFPISYPVYKDILCFPFR